jgi:hypothetical protein
MTINVKKLAADALAVALAVSGVLAVLLNVSGTIHLPAPEIAWLVAASGVVAAIINVIRPYANAALKRTLGK